MDKTASPAASITALILVACMTTAAVVGCKSRPPVDPEANNSNTTNGTGTGTGTPDPELQRALREAREQNQNLESQVQDLRGQVDDLNGRISTLDRQLADSKSEATRLRTQRDALVIERDNLQKNVNDLRVALDEARRASSGVTPFTDKPEPIEPASVGGQRPELGEGWKRQPMEGAFGFDYPGTPRWKVDVSYGIDSTTYHLTSPDGAKMLITVWPYLKDSADALAGERYATTLRDLQDQGVTPTTEQEVQAAEECLANKPGHVGQIRYEQDGTTMRKRFAAANLSSGGGEGDVFGSMLSVLVEYTWDANNEGAETAYGEIVSRFWVR